MPPSFIRTTYAPVPVPVDDADDTDDTSGVRLVFDTGSLAYTCLKGCMYMLHKSMLHYPVIIKNTLVDGYGIQLRIKTYSKDDDWLDVPSEIFKLAVRIKDAVKITEAVLANDVVKAARAHPFLNADTFAALKTRQADRQQLDKLEMQQLWEYSMAVMKYRVRPDAEFIDAYVGAYISSQNVRGMNDLFRQLSRFGRAQEDIAKTLQRCYDDERRAINCSANSDMNKALGEVHTFWPPAIAVCNLLDVLDTEWRGKVDAALDGDDDALPIKFSSNAAATALLGWVERMTDDEYSKLLEVLDIKPRKEQPSRTRGQLLACLRGLGDGDGDAEAPGGSTSAPPVVDDAVTPPKATRGRKAAPKTPRSTPRGKVLTGSKLVSFLCRGIIFYSTTQASSFT